LGKFLEKFFSGEEIFDFLEDSAPLDIPKEDLRKINTWIFGNNRGNYLF
jgi:hypothetical protein